VNGDARDAAARYGGARSAKRGSHHAMPPPLFRHARFTPMPGALAPAPFFCYHLPPITTLSAITTPIQRLDCFCHAMLPDMPAFAAAILLRFHVHDFDVVLLWSLRCFCLCRPLTALFRLLTMPMLRLCRQ